MTNKVNTQKILEFMEQEKMSRNAFRKACRLSYATLNHILDVSQNVDIKSLFKIARVINCYIENFFI